MKVQQIETSKGKTWEVDGYLINGGQKVRVKKYEEVREIYIKISMPRLPEYVYERIYTVKNVEKNMDSMDIYRDFIISNDEDGYKFFPFELEHYEDNK